MFNKGINKIKILSEKSNSCPSNNSVPSSAPINYNYQCLPNSQHNQQFLQSNSQYSQNQQMIYSNDMMQKGQPFNFLQPQDNISQAYTCDRTASNNSYIKKSIGLNQGSEYFIESLSEEIYQQIKQMINVKIESNIIDISEIKLTFEEIISSYKDSFENEIKKIENNTLKGLEIIKDNIKDLFLSIQTKLKYEKSCLSNRLAKKLDDLNSLYIKLADLCNSSESRNYRNTNGESYSLELNLSYEKINEIINLVKKQQLNNKIDTFNNNQEKQDDFIIQDEQAINSLLNQYYEGIEMLLNKQLQENRNKIISINQLSFEFLAEVSKRRIEVESKTKITIVQQYRLFYNIFDDYVLEFTPILTTPSNELLYLYEKEVKISNLKSKTLITSYIELSHTLKFD